VCAEFFIEQIFSVCLEDVKCLAKNEQYLWMIQSPGRGWKGCIHPNQRFALPVYH